MFQILTRSSLAEMNTPSKPFVSVLTPVYNGEKYLAECIESVLAQEYDNWEYVIVNNRSTDRTLDIILEYAKREPRIRICENDEFLPVMQNLNNAFRQISPRSKYCKVVHADDWLFPNCLRRMVEVAEENSSVGMVGAYGLKGDRVEMDGLPISKTVFNGREIARAYLFHIAKLGGIWVFGSPTSTLIRSDLVRQRDRFYDESDNHGDTSVCCELLRESDFGFVHQVLTYTRQHAERQTAFADRYLTNVSGEFKILFKYGRLFLSDEEFDQCLRCALNNYYLMLAQSFFQKRDSDFRRFHYQTLEELGFPIRSSKLIKALASEVLSMLLRPTETWQRVRLRLLGSNRQCSPPGHFANQHQFDCRSKATANGC